MMSYLEMGSSGGNGGRMGGGRGRVSRRVRGW